MKKSTLILHNVKSCIGEKEILKGISLKISSGKIHAIMGPNGAGKSTLALSLMGNPDYKIKDERSNMKYEIDGEDMIDLTPEERARHGLFVSFQHPVEISGVTMLAFLRTAYKALRPEEKIPLGEFKIMVKEALDAVGLSQAFMGRSINEGFSGGEKKRAEIVQLLILRPKFAILDEIDSGLDIDSLKLVAQVIGKAVREYNMGILLITHYQRILHYLKPDAVHILIDGKIKKSDGMKLVRQIEKSGYAAI